MVFRLGVYCLCGRGVARFFEAEPTEFCVVNRVNRSICSDGLGAVQRGWILALGLAMPHANNVIEGGGSLGWRSFNWIGGGNENRFSSS